MKQFIILVTIIVLVSGCGKSQQKAKEAEKEKSYSIAYNIHVPGSTKDDWEIMHMNFDGSDKKNITSHLDVAWTYYAFNKRLFFISDRDTCYRCYFLYECDADGNNVKKVSNLQLEDSWMSSRNNGEEMIATGRIGKTLRHQLFIIKISNGEFRQITTDTAALYRDPCFSPDGKKIVFSYQKSKRDKSSHEELYLMNDDASEFRQLTHYPENNPSAKDYGYRAGASRWHPTENFISYVSKQDGRHSIFAITPDGKRQWKLIDNPNSEGWHDWSSDGKWLAFNSSDNQETQFHIILMNWNTKMQKLLTDTTYNSQLAPVFIEK